jgi:hypothetical protein
MKFQKSPVKVIQKVRFLIIFFGCGKERPKETKFGIQKRKQYRCFCFRKTLRSGLKWRMMLFLFLQYDDDETVHNSSTLLTLLCCPQLKLPNIQLTCHHMHYGIRKIGQMSGATLVGMQGLTPLVFAGPSGVGKGTLVNLLMTRYPDIFGFSVSNTTRQPRYIPHENCR